MNDWRVTPLLFRKPGNAEYVDRVVKDIQALNIEKRPISTMQALSAQRVLDMTDEELKAYQARPMVTRAQCAVDKDAEKIAAELMMFHPSRIQSSILAEQERHKSKNTIGDAINEGLSSASEESKIRAAEAYRVTPPAQLTEAQKEKLTEVNLITEYSGPAETKPQKKKSWFIKFFGSAVRSKGFNRDEL